LLVLISRQILVTAFQHRNLFKLKTKQNNGSKQFIL